MVWVVTNCDWCGVVELSPDQVTVRLCTADLTATHVFVCPTCGRGVARTIQANMTNVLFEAGSQLVIWELPDELDEPRSGPPISHDDVLAMHELLSSPDWFDSLGRM